MSFDSITRAPSINVEVHFLKPIDSTGKKRDEIALHAYNEVVAAIALIKQQAAIEPIIGHLKQDYRLSRNWLKGSEGDAINLLMAACAWNLRK